MRTIGRVLHCKSTQQKRYPMEIYASQRYTVRLIREQEKATYTFLK